MKIAKTLLCRKITNVLEYIGVILRLLCRIQIKAVFLFVQ